MKGNLSTHSTPIISPIKQCLSCDSALLTEVISFGDTPIADHLLTPELLATEDIVAPLDLQFCEHCGLLQLAQSIDPQWIYGSDYPYFSSVTESLLLSSKQHVDEIISTQGLTDESLVVEVASNDGYLLQYFTQQNIPVIGIDPVSRQAQKAIDKGVNTLTEFFCLMLAKNLSKQGQQADTIIAKNVLAHVPQLNDFVAGLAKLLKPDGLIYIELPYVVDLIQKKAFDTIYHQHLCYFSLSSLKILFTKHGLFINQCQRLAILGGALRLTLSKHNNPSAQVIDILNEEQENGVPKFNYYAKFADQLKQWKTQFITLIDQLTTEGKSIAAYGASAKGAMLLAYCGLDKQTIEFVVDINPYKHGLAMPVSRIPVYPVSHLDHAKPDYTLLLVWNIADEILQQQSEYRQQGGKFIIPIQNPVII